MQYTVCLYKNEDKEKSLPYTFNNIEANNPEEACNKAKEFVAKNGWWNDLNSSLDDKIKQLNVEYVYLSKNINDCTIIEEPWEDFDGRVTVSLSLDKEGVYTISEFIKLLEEAKRRFGDKEVLIHHMNENIIGGFSHIYLHHGFDERETYGEDYYQDNTICIYG